MKLVLQTAPTIEPITLAELKLHLRLDSGSFAGNIDETQSIAPGSHAIADNYTTHAGTAVEVLGYSAVVSFQAGTNGDTGTVDVKVQDSDDGSTWTDWGTAFTQVTTSNDNATYEKAYTGIKRYIRTVAKVLLAACEFGTTVIRREATSIEDDDLNDLIEDAREDVEHYTRRALLTQTWDYYLNEFPVVDYIKIPLGNLASVTHVKYTDSDGDETTLTETTDYLVETNGEGIGRIVLPYGVSWPDFTAYPSNPIVIRFVAGWTAAANVPGKIRRAVKFTAENMHQHGGRSEVLTKLVTNLLFSWRLWDEF